MSGLIRQGHFLGAKLRALRKRNGLTLDELSARCVQIDAESAPSVSYLSMVETGKRTPSAATLDMLAGIFSKDARWFLDENTDVEAAPPNRERGGLEAMPLEPAFLFSHGAVAERVARALVADRHDGAAVRAAPHSRMARDATQQFSGYRARRGAGRQAPDAAHARCGAWSLQAPRPRDPLVRRRRPQARRGSGALALRSARNGVHQQALAQPEGAAQVRARVLRRPQDPAQRRRRDLAAHRRAHGRGRHGPLRPRAWGRKTCCSPGAISSAASSPERCSVRAFRSAAFSCARRISVSACRKLGVTPGAGDAPHDRGVPLPPLALL